MTCFHYTLVIDKRVTLLNELLVIMADIKRCDRCGAWLSLGPSNDDISYSEQWLAARLSADENKNARFIDAASEFP